MYLIRNKLDDFVSMTVFMLAVLGVGWSLNSARETLLTPGLLIYASSFSVLALVALVWSARTFDLPLRAVVFMLSVAMGALAPAWHDVFVSMHNGGTLIGFHQMPWMPWYTSQAAMLTLVAILIAPALWLAGHFIYERR